MNKYVNLEFGPYDKSENFYPVMALNTQEYLACRSKPGGDATVKEMIAKICPDVLEGCSVVPTVDLEGHYLRGMDEMKKAVDQIADCNHDLILVCECDEEYEAETAFIITRQNFIDSYLLNDQKIQSDVAIMSAAALDEGFIKIPMKNGDLIYAAEYEFDSDRNDRHETMLMRFIDGDIKFADTFAFDLSKCDWLSKAALSYHGFVIPDYNYPYPVPDASLTKKDMFDHGYFYEGMLPLSLERAKELAEFVPIYMLYDDGSEAQLSAEEVKEYSNDNLAAMFGVEKCDWATALKRYATMKKAMQGNNWDKKGGKKDE